MKKQAAISHWHLQQALGKARRIVEKVKERHDRAFEGQDVILDLMLSSSLSSLDMALREVEQIRQHRREVRSLMAEEMRGRSRRL